MAKRRSSTRVGRKGPSAAALARRLEADAKRNGVRPSSRRIVSRPLVDGDVVLRWILGASEQVEVQEWSAPYWRPSLLPLYRVHAAQPASHELLTALAVPESDWISVGMPRWEKPLLLPITREPLSLGGFDMNHDGERANAT